MTGVLRTIAGMGIFFAGAVIVGGAIVAYTAVATSLLCLGTAGVGISKIIRDRQEKKEQREIK